MPASKPLPKWLADPFCCLAKAQKTTLEAHLTPCAVLTQRNEANVKTTPLIVTKEVKGTRWSFSHLSVLRDSVMGLRARFTGGNGKDYELPYMTGLEATQLSDCLRAAASNASAASCGGKSIREMLEEELDTIVERLMTYNEAEDGRDPGRAEGVAYALAVFLNPYLPNIESVREAAMDRWYEANPEEDE